MSTQPYERMLGHPRLATKNDNVGGSRSVQRYRWGRQETAVVVATYCSSNTQAAALQRATVLAHQPARVKHRATTCSLQ